MEENTIIFAIVVVIFSGIIFLFLKMNRKYIPEKAVDSWRKELWDSGINLVSVEPLKFSQAAKVFGMNVVSFAMYQNNYFAKITAEDADHQTVYYFAAAHLAFNKKVIKTELKQLGNENNKFK